MQFAPKLNIYPISISSKAFDRINHWHLLDKLLVYYTFLCILVLSTQVFLWNGAISVSVTFNVINGLRQGGKFSMCIQMNFVGPLIENWLLHSWGVYEPLFILQMTCQYKNPLLMNYKNFYSFVQTMLKNMVLCSIPICVCVSNHWNTYKLFIF